MAYANGEMPSVVIAVMGIALAPDYVGLQGFGRLAARPNTEDEEDGEATYHGASGPSSGSARTAALGFLAK